MKLRIKFKKYGPVRFIGHLDVMRFYQKALRRAAIDVAYSAGFSPHQIMSFASPLGVGLASNGEYMDIQVNTLPQPETEDITPCELLVKRLNDAGVPGLDAVSARILPEDAGNAMASVAAASYTVRFRQGREPAFIYSKTTKQETADDSSALANAKSRPADAVQSAVAAFLAKDEILFTKETKRGVREINLRPGIYELIWRGSAFSMLLDASSAGNIKPAQVMTALLADCGETLKENALLITREDLFTDMGEEGKPRFVSLGDIGFEKGGAS